MNRRWTARSPRNNERQAQIVLWLAIELWLLNLADLLLTRHAMSLGFASESNQLMAGLFRAGLLQAVLFKIGIVTLGALLLWRLRAYRAALVGAALLTLALATVVMYEVLWVTSL